MNKIDTVGVDIRDHVLRVAATLQYAPQAAARALATQKSKVVGAIIPTLEDQSFAIAIEALQRKLQHHGYTLLLAISNYDPQEERIQIATLISQGIAGLLLVGSNRDPAIYETLVAKNIAYINTWVLDSRHACVGFNNESIGITIAQHLLNLGHQDFAVIAQYSPESDRAAQRIVGVKKTLAAKGMKAPTMHMIESSHKIIDGQLVMSFVLQSNANISAVICGTDTLAFGAMIEARLIGKRIPEDISITGINNAEFSAHLSPALTTIELDATAVGANAADYLLRKIEAQIVSRTIEIPFELIVRGSTGPASP